jgi:GTPase involved in cell partitioning and DNA repair
VVFTKADLVQEPLQELEDLKKELDATEIPWFEISAVRGDGIQNLIYKVFEMVEQVKTIDQQAIPEVDPEPVSEPVPEDPLDAI